ncbi:hypothetical protein [Aquimarina pacifica]|uniref:hypothetical protein n=1 Tax=Aquimarina pacifica TaxID=1296415 RepID=UPI000472E9B9|nr:hypothetical protein [Aquimarina pacifica]
METIEATLTSLKDEQKVNLINGCFSPSEAATIINSLLQEKINFHKLQRLSLTEGNNQNTCEFDNKRIDELIYEQALAKEFFSQARLDGKKLVVKSTISIEIEQ